MDGSTMDTAAAAAERRRPWVVATIEVAGPSLASLARACFRSSFTWLGLESGLGFRVRVG